MHTQKCTKAIVDFNTIILLTVDKKCLDTDSYVPTSVKTTYKVRKNHIRVALYLDFPCNCVS